MSSGEPDGIDSGTLHLPLRPVASPLRLVLDTNVWLDWLVFEDADVVPLKAAVATGRAEIVVDEAVVEELKRVLGYPFGARTLGGEAQLKCLAECARVSTRSNGTAVPIQGYALPVCADPDDQKFLDLAAACGARYLVTRDRDLLELARHRDPAPPFGIVTPRELHALLSDA